MQVQNYFGRKLGSPQKARRKSQNRNGKFDLKRKLKNYENKPEW